MLFSISDSAFISSACLLCKFFCDRANLFVAMLGTCDSYQYKIHLVVEQEGASAEELISRRLDRPQQCGSSQPSVHTHWNFVCELTNRPCVRRAPPPLGASRGTPATSYYLVRCALPRSHEAARDLMTRARFRLERVSVSKNEQSASQACLTLQCTAFEKGPHISSGGF